MTTLTPRAAVSFLAARGINVSREAIYKAIARGALKKSDVIGAVTVDSENLLTWAREDFDASKRNALAKSTKDSEDSGR